MPHVIIVGGGISGLTLAYRLCQAAPSVEVTILESSNRPGGTIWTERRDGFRVEIGPNGFLASKPSTYQLCQELGLGDQLVQATEAASKNRYLFLDGKLKKLPAGLGDLLRTDLLSWRGKLQLVTEAFRSPKRNGGDESIDAFARRRAGREVAEVFADALVTGIHAGDPALLSIRATFPRIAQFEEQHGSVIKGFLRSARQRRGELKGSAGMWSLRGGLRLLVEKLSEPNGVSRRVLHTGIHVRQIASGRSPDTGRPFWTVHGEGRDSWTADAVVLACPAYQQAGILADLDQELAEQIGGIAYNRVAVIALGYRQADVPILLDGFGYIAPQRTRRDVLGVQWCSSIFPDRAPWGTVLLRALSGGWQRPETVGWDDDLLLRAVRDELRLAMGIAAEPIFHHIVRWDRAIPQYLLGHLDRVARIEQRLNRHPGLFLGGNAYHGIALNDCTEHSAVLARQIAQYLG